MMTLQETKYPRLGETVYRQTLENGLEIVLIPKSEFQETIGLIASRFGALDLAFRPKNRKLIRQFPAGIAHFLEHKLFELPNGADAMTIFAQLGAEVNAFTGYNQTVYYFSTASQALKALELLQQFTSKLNITEESINREKAIITQEINMYQDDPDYQLYMSVLGQLYPNTALAQDIAGSAESIVQITSKELVMNYDIFYQPSNMVLLLMGDFDIEEVATSVEAFQNGRRPRKKVPIEKQAISLQPVLASSSMEFSVVGPKLAVGLRSQSNFTNLSIFRYRLSIKLLMAMILGWTSSTYQDWYDKGKIDDSFQMEIEITQAYQFLILTMDTSEPMAMSKRIRQLLHQFESLEDLNEAHLTLVKQEMYGEFLKSLNHLESTAMQYVNAWIDEEDLFEFPEILDSISLDDILSVGRDFMAKSEMTDFIIFPQ
ncbi:EF-P 5-aminopentanol modification-associated protein YfmH [Streptococcus merionis]|uniref:EF-P 5-aminopentanol modification-associated protein YfmH n=1 Tax=Streptococcus merionis TaxID=400065 RepID=UPI003514C8E3